MKNIRPRTALLPDPFPLHNQYLPYINQTPQYYQPQTPTSSYPRPYNSRPFMQSSKSVKRKQESIICDTCGIEVNSQQMMNTHILGQKHIKRMKLKETELSNQTFDSMNNNPTPLMSIASSDIENEPTQLSTVIKPLGTNPSNGKSTLQLINELAKFNKVMSKYDLIKETGPGHCKQFEVQLTVADKIYTGTGTSIKRAQQVAAEQALAMTSLIKPEYEQREIPYKEEEEDQQQQQINSPNENIFENLLNKKCIDISECDSTIIAVNQFVEDIERAMKSVSDKMMEQCQINNILVVPDLSDHVQLDNMEQANEDPSESFRMLKGAMKVSILAMHLFLQTDYEYTLILICANKPNKTLLNDICRILTITLNTQATSINQSDSLEQQSISHTYQVQTNVVDACLTVKYSLLPQHTIRIILTSPVFRNESSHDLDEETRQTIKELNPDPIDMLDRNKCLQAAAEIRHSNWFAHNMPNHCYNSPVLRLLRHLQFHQTPLTCLNLWCLVLLVHKCQNRPIKSITTLFRAVFACLSSGILLPNKFGLGIIDPCEKDLLDIADYLTNEQRINITTYAQHVLRLIAFEQFEKIFPLI